MLHRINKGVAMTTRTRFMLSTIIFLSGIPLSALAGPGDYLIPDVGAGQVMAGRWTYRGEYTPSIWGSRSSGSSATLEFSGRDNKLSGTFTLLVTLLGNTTENVEPLTNVSKIRRTVSLTRAEFGPRTGQVSEEGTRLVFQSNDPDAPDPIVYYKQ